MGVKTYAFNIFSAIFSVLIIIANWFGYFIHKSFSPFRLRSRMNKGTMLRWTGVSQSGKREILEYSKILVNIILGVMLSESLIIYQEYIIETIILTSYQINSFILKWAVDVPDYTGVLRQSYTLNLLSGIFYIVFGFLGISNQINFTLDIVTIITLPFSVTEIFLNKFYGKLSKLKDIMIDILTINKKYWVTCPYPQIVLKDTFKIIYICALPLVFYLMVLFKIYSVIFGLITLVFQAINTIGFNISLFVEELGTIFCCLTGLSVEEGVLEYSNNSVDEKISILKNKILQIEWESLFRFKDIKDVFVGNHGQKQSLEWDDPYFPKLSIIEVYQKFLVFQK